MGEDLKKVLKPFTEKKNFSATAGLMCKTSHDMGKTFGKATYHDCNSSSFSNLGWSSEVIIFVVQKHNIKYSDKDIVNWIKFVNECGYPCSFEFKEESVEIMVKGSDYVSHSHYKAGLTVVRYICYWFPNKADHYPNICKNSIKFFLNEKISAHEALCKAHNVDKPKRDSLYGDYNSQYFCAEHALNFNVKPITKEEMLKKCKNHPSSCINDIFVK